MSNHTSDGKTNHEQIGESVEDLASRFRIRTTRLGRRLRREAEIGLSPTLLSALTVIGARGPVTLGQLAEIEGIAPPSVTKIVGKLEGSDLVVRVADPDDRRVRLVEVTPDGAALLEEYRSRRTEWLAARFADLDDDQRDAVAVVCDLLDELLSEPTDDRNSP